MNRLFNRASSQHRLAAATLTLLPLLAGLPAPTLAGPGAHGPNGEHLDAPSTVRAGSALPRIEAHTDAFELVAELRPRELAIVVDRYESNEPVLSARLDVESGTLKAVAVFRAEQGDYAVTDPALLKALAAPGEHGLVFTLVAGADSDLLDGTMVSATGLAAGTTAGSDQAQAHRGDEHSHGPEHALQRAAWIGAAVAALGLVSGVAWWRQRRRAVAQRQGDL